MAKVLFLQKALYENMGVMQLAAILKKHGHACAVHIAPNAAGLSKAALERFAPDIIGLPVMTNDRAWAVAIATHLKRAGEKAPILVGGAHPTYFPEYLEEACFDLLNVGEGDDSLRELADAVDAKADYTTIRNLHVKVDGKIQRNPLRPLVPMTDLPIPDREIYLDKAGYAQSGLRHFYISRGCPYHCTFCFVHNFRELYKDDPLRSKGRLKTVDRFVEEYRTVASLGKVSLINFIDSTFNLNRAWMREFLARYRDEIGAPYTFNLTAGLLDEEMAAAIAATGSCVFVRMGVETGNEQLRSTLLGKRLSNRTILQAVELLHRHKIEVVTYNMFGLPGETVDQAYETIRLNQQLKINHLVPYIFNPFPGLRLTDYAVQHGYLSERVARGEDPEGVGAHQPSEFYFSKLRQPDIGTVQNLCMLAHLAVKVPALGPFVKLLARLPPNRLYQAIYFLTFSITYGGMYRLGLWDAMKLIKRWTV